MVERQARPGHGHGRRLASGVVANAVSFDIDQGAIEAALESPLRAWLQGLCTKVASEAFVRAPVGKATPVHPMSNAPARIPGRLKHSIDTEITGNGLQLIGWIIANAPYARFVHEGTQGGYDIEPKRPAYALAFWSEKKAGFVVTPRVTNHPGIATPQPFLRDALVKVVG